MDVLATAFVCVWVSVAFYVGWLGYQQRQLASRLDELSFRAAELRDVNRKSGRAA